MGTSVAVQWLGLPAPNAGGKGSIPGWGIKILPAKQHGQKKKKKSIQEWKCFAHPGDVFYESDSTAA